MLPEETLSLGSIVKVIRNCEITARARINQARGEVNCGAEVIEALVCIYREARADVQTGF